MKYGNLILGTFVGLYLKFYCRGFCCVIIKPNLLETGSFNQWEMCNRGKHETLLNGEIQAG